MPVKPFPFSILSIASAALILGLQVQAAQAAKKEQKPSKLEIAEKLVRGDHPDRAKPLLLEIVKAEPKNTLAWYLLGEAYQDLGLLDGSEGSARQCFLKVLSLDPQHSRAYTKLGDLAGVDGDYIKQVEYCQKALKCPNPDPFALKYKAIAYSNLKRDRMALECFEQFRAQPTIVKDDPRVLKVLANLQENGGKYQEALVTLDKLEKPGKDRDFEIQRARVLEKMGKLQEAVAIFTNMLSVKGNEDDEAALTKRAELYEKQGRLKEAMADLNKLISGSPSAAAYKKRAALWTKLGNKDKAREDLSKSDQI
jgi:tetratricopeptide (TPR) repeat protein